MRKRKQAQNKRAFDRVIREYTSRKMKTVTSIIDASVEGKPTINRAAPSDSDFFCDVELVWEEVLNDNYLIAKFISTYLLENDDMTAGEQRSAENKLGRAFINRRIYPVEKYFRTEKK